MSRIPKMGSIPSEIKPSQIKPSHVQSAVRPSATAGAGVKRAAEEKQVPLREKKPRSCLNEIANGKVLGTIQPSQGKNNFSEKAKKAFLQPLPSDTNLVRESMPAMRSLNPNVPGRTKRPAWDLKGRIQDMEEHFQRTQMRNASLMENLEANNQRIAALEAANSMLHRDVEVKSEQSEEASAQIRKLETILKQKTEECEALFKEKESEALKGHALNHKLTWLQNDYNQLQQMYQEETSSLKSSITSLSSSKSVMQSQLEATQLLLQNEQEEKEKLISQKQSLLQRIEDLEDKLREGETVRRKLHNTVQELKGNIRVYCRLRPPLQQELKRGMVVANIQVAKEKSIEIYQLSESSKEPKYDFSFDSVFPPSASQEEVFAEISQLVQSSLDGYNVCIFAYGQTGSGKTFTMEGPESIQFSSENPEPHLGMIPRSVCQIFQSISELEPRGWKYHIEALFLEIYNERIQNLLDHRNSNGKCEIVKSGRNGTDCKLSNVTASEVTSSEQVFELLKKARISRAVAATKCNEYSSRSHFVFQLKIYGENVITNKKCEGTLNLVDLAGSERVKESGSAGERLTEAKAINKSLSNLGNVIMSLSKKESHIPYRDSKLTHLLANSLGGNSKTLMFVNIGPDNENLNETINSLRFATKVNQCNIGTAQKRVK